MYPAALGAVGNNFLDARSANNHETSFLPGNHGPNVSVPIATCVGRVASGRRSALGSPIVRGCRALHPLLYLFLEDLGSDFIINRREIGVELPATRKYIFVLKCANLISFLDRFKSVNCSASLAM